MTLEICVVAVGILLVFALFDLIVGVSNDAVNFLNSSIGSNVASRQVIMLVASAGILIGVFFSGGMMEVARKGIFHPQLFTMPELLALFTAVMLADIVILDVFNTYGIPTSTTVSIVFELLGAAVALSLLKLLLADGHLADLSNYINTAKAMVIILGILLSVVVAFVAGAVTQFFARLAFTFAYEETLLRWGGVWGGLSTAALVHFIVLKGAKHAVVLYPETIEWIQHHSVSIFWLSLLVGGLVFQMLTSVFRVNVLKPVVLMGTFALALAFAANDLVNFIGVPLAGLNAYTAALATENPLTAPMTALQGTVSSNGYLLGIAGVVMVLTLWFSRRAQKVTSTSVDLGRQEEEGIERFESAALARVLVRMVSAFFSSVRLFFPRAVRKFVKRRMHTRPGNADDSENAPPFDLVRASVNLIVASVVISLATSHKLPLSTTYVTFMVAMGSSFSDQAWGRETAVYRVTGVLTVIGCWFLTAVLGFSLAFVCGGILGYLGGVGGVLLMLLAGVIVWRNKYQHDRQLYEQNQEAVFNLRKIESAPEALSAAFEQGSILLVEIRSNIDKSLEALFRQDLDELRRQRRGTKKAARWASIITANVYKVLRLLSQEEIERRPDFALTNKSLQNIAECNRDVIVRAYEHVRNYHSPLLSIQAAELGQAHALLHKLLTQISSVLAGEQPLAVERARQQHKELKELGRTLNEKQVERVRNRSSKTRLSILYYSILSDIERMARHSVRLLEIYQSVSDDGQPTDNMEATHVS